MKVDMNLLPMKGHYFLYNAGTGLVIPFMPVLAKELGFSSVIVGMIYTILPILGLVAKPAVGMIADWLHWQKGVFLTFIVLTMASLSIIPWIPPIDTPANVQVHCDADSVVKVCSKNLDSSLCYPQPAQRLGNTSFKCNLECTADSAFVESVCETWNQPKYCSQLTKSTHFLLLPALHNASKSQLTTEWPKPVFKASGPQTLEFSATLLPTHAELLESCLFIRLSEVQFGGASAGVVPYCNSFQSASCRMTACENEALNEITSDREPISDSDAVHMYQFWMFCLSLIGGWVSMAIVVSISDAICFELLGDFPSKYGNQRLFGALGWGLLSFCGGLVIDYYSRGKAHKDHTPVFVMMVIFLILNVLVAWKLKYQQIKTSPSILRDVGRLLSEVRVLIFIFWCIVTGMCTAMLWNFLFWYLEELADCDTKANIKTLEGLAMVFQCLGGELPFFFLSGWVLKKIGHIHTMSLVLISFSLRFFLYSLLSNPWWVLPIELLQGLTFGLAYASMASYASIVAPPGTEATTQGLVGAVFEGLGVSTGSFVGGYLMKNMDKVMVFRLYSGATLLACFIHALAQFFFAKRTAVLNIHEKAGS